MQAAFSGTAGTGKSFAKAKDVIPAPAWNRGNLEEWRASLSEERRRADEERLSYLFNLAAKVPELKDALDWAREHGIEFIVDRQARAGGYYTIGTGVVALVEQSFCSDARAVGVLVHEIRHAWQDYYGMFPTTGKSFPGYFMRLSACEADATAHQQLASGQYERSVLLDASRKKREALDPTGIPELQKTVDDKQSDESKLWQGFQSWYRGKADFYWRFSASWLGSRLGIPGVTVPDLRIEYQPYKDKEVPKIEGIDITRDEQLRRLGKGFKGGNYFNVASRDQLAREYLSPLSAERGFTRLRPGFVYATSVRKTVNEIRRRQLRLKHERGYEALI